jgi:hypothetical protein
MTAERLFLEFQRTRDPACLGQVFDLCADDLFAVALHLCRDRAAAEDALQATFLCAIERAHRYTAGRPGPPVRGLRGEVGHGCSQYCQEPRRARPACVH